MYHPHLSRGYEKWAPVLGRVLFAVPFIVGAWFKVPGTAFAAFEIGMTRQVGVPFPEAAVLIAFVIEVIASIALIVGWKTRTTAFLLMLYTILLTLLFHSSNLGDPNNLGMFVSHLYLIGGLLYLSVYGAQHAAIEKDPLPR